MSKTLKSKYKPTAKHFRHILVFYFNQKKNVNEGYNFLQIAYSDLAPSKTFCDIWFKRFESGDVDFCCKKRGNGRQPPRQFKDEELIALLDDDDTQTLQELAESLGVSQSSVSDRLNVMGIIPKDKQ